MFVVSTSIECSMNEPRGDFKAAEQPEVLSGLCLDAEVVAANGLVAPPAGFDSLRPPIANDAVLATVPAKLYRCALRTSGRGFDGLWWYEETERADGKRLFGVRCVSTALDLWSRMTLGGNSPKRC